jgi:hypothetical protein
MKIYKRRLEGAARLLWLALAILLVWPVTMRAESEQSFPLLQVGTHVYTNVTVTTKAKTYIFILHQDGMNSVKVANLPPDVRQKLGYAMSEKPDVPTNAAAAWAKAEVAKLETPQLKEMRTRLAGTWRGGKLSGAAFKQFASSTLVLSVLGALLLVYLFHCYCFKLICQKAGHPPGILVWLPVAQWFPLLRAAGMSAWWFVASLLPFLNIAAFVLWCVKIAKARGKSGWVAFFLILPLTSFPAILYLAFSDENAEKDGEEPQVMTLQTA